MATDRVHYLGRITYAATREKYRYATIEPLVESNTDGTHWLGPIHDLVSLFPKRGLVHWHDAHTNAQKGSVWQFTTEERPSDRPEQFQAEHAEEPIEIIDVRSWADEMALRSAITGVGIPLTPAPLGRRILLWTVDGVFVGPLLLKAGNEPGLWVVDAPVAHRDSARMPIYRLASDDVNPVDVNGRRWFVSPRLQLSGTTEVQNWTSDAQVARSILGRLRKMEPELVKAVGVTDNIFREYLDRIESAQFGGADPAVERARADRLRGIRKAIESEVELLTEAGTALLATEVVSVEVNKKVESAIAERLKQRQDEIEAAIAADAARLTHVQVELTASETQLATVNEELAAKRGELAQAVESFEQELSGKLSEIASRPEKLFAESAVLRVVLSSFVHQARLEGQSTPPITTVHETSVPVHVLMDDAALRAALAAHAGASSVSVHAILGVHAVVTAGIVPLVTGTRGYELLRAYASAVAGGRLHWIPVPSSTMDPTDLLGSFDVGLQRIQPNASGLLDIVGAARQSGRLQIVVPEGFNRAAVDAYLKPILESARSERAHDHIRAIPLANPTILQRDDPYRNMARFSWPTSVVLACLPSDGNITLPVPESMLPFFGVIDSDDPGRPIMTRPPAPGGSAPSTSEMADQLWQDVVDRSCHDDAVADAEKLLALHRAFALSARDADDARRVFGVLRANGLPVPDATAVAADTILVPRFRGDAKVIESALRTSGVDLPGWKAVLAEARRLTS